MRIGGRVNLVLHITSPPRAVCAGGIDQSDGKFVQIFQGAGDGLAGGKADRDFRFRVLRIEHPLFEFKALVTRADSSKIAGRRVTTGASARSIEVLLAGFSVSGLQVFGIHSLAATGFRERLGLLRVDEGYEALNLIIRPVKAWHAFVGASVAYDRTDLVSVDIRSHQFGARQVGSALPTTGVAAVTERAVLAQECCALLHKIS